MNDEAADGARRRFLEELLALCDRHSVNLETCGCDDGLKVVLRGLPARPRDAFLYGVGVDDKGAHGHRRYYDEVPDIEVRRKV